MAHRSGELEKRGLRRPGRDSPANTSGFQNQTVETGGTEIGGGLQTDRAGSDDDDFQILFLHGNPPIVQSTGRG